MKLAEIRTNVRFLNIMKKYPCIWNYELIEYTQKHKVATAWRRVCNEAADTEENCRERWRKIRNSYVKSLRASRKYYLADYLHFLRPYTKKAEYYIKQSTSYKALSSITDADEEEEDQMEEEAEHEYVPDEQNERNELYEQNEQNGNILYEDTNSMEDSASVNRLKKSSSIADAAFIEWVKHKKSRKHCNDDSDELFMRSLVTYMRDMTGKQNRAFRRRVMCLIDDILENVDVSPARSDYAATSSNIISTATNSSLRSGNYPPAENETFTEMYVDSSSFDTNWDIQMPRCRISNPSVIENNEIL